jgi:type II secretory pathway pseudopilin PulG
MTLVEVLVATVLLGVGVTGLLAVGSLAVRNQQRTAQRAAALCVAQERLAEIEIVGPYVWTLGHPTRGVQELGGLPYEWTIQIEALSAGELFSVLVEVEWPGPGGGRVRLETWLNDYGAVRPETSERTAAAAHDAPSPPRRG